MIIQIHWIQAKIFSELMDSAIQFLGEEHVLSHGIINEVNAECLYDL